MATSNIKDRFIRTAILKGGRTNDFVQGDLRGKHVVAVFLVPRCDLIEYFIEETSVCPKNDFYLIF